METPELIIENDNDAVEDQEQENLREAIKREEIHRINEIFLNNPSLVNKPWITPIRETPLHFALRSRLDDVVELLLNQEGIEESVNQVDQRGNLPVQLAIRGNRSERYILALIEKTSQSGLESRSEYGDTLIHLASRSGQVPVLDKLYTLLPEGIINSTNAGGFTAIHDAIDNWDVVSWLLKHNATRLTNDNGDTLLHATVTPGILGFYQGGKTRQCLLARGEDLGIQNNDGNTPIHLVANNLNSYQDETGMASTVLRELLGAPKDELKLSSLVKALEKRNNAGDTVLHIIASNTTLTRDEGKKVRAANEAVQAITSICPNILMSRDRQRNTPLHRACLVENWFLVEALIQAGQSLGSESKDYDIVNLQNEAGDTPLHLAVCKGQIETVKNLMDAAKSEGTILIRNNREQTILHIAASQSRPEILNRLLTGWASYEEVVFADHERELRDKRGMTPLHIAAEGSTSYHLDVTELVDQILKGCTGPKLLNQTDLEKRWTPLHFAASRGHERIAELLLLNGADSKKTDINNLVAAEVARRANHIDVADFIRQYRRRGFRLGLEPRDDYTAEVDEYFLVLSWPNWDKSVRQQRGEPPRMWPHMAPIHQLISDARDTYYQLDKGFLDLDLLEISMIPLISDSFVIDLAPIQQAQIRLSSCGKKGWVMAPSRYRRYTHRDRLHDISRKSDKPVRNVYAYDPSVFRYKKRATRWINFPANNVCTKMLADFRLIRLFINEFNTQRAWIEVCTEDNSPEVLT